MKLTLKEGNDTIVQTLQLSGVTTNYILLGYLGFAFPLSKRFTLMPKIGAGYVMQTTQVTGSSTGNFNNGFVAFGAGADVLFSINKNLDLSLGLTSLGELERDTLTYVFQGIAGIRLKL